MQVTEQGPASRAEQLTHTRPAVERWLIWSGSIPLPAFLLLHISRELALSFSSDVSEVVRPVPGVAGVLSSVALVWLPLALHAGLGVWLLLRQAGQRPSGNAPSHARADTGWLPRRVSQVTSLLALAFLLYHAREYPLSVALGESDPSDVGFILLARLSATSYGVPLRSFVYLLGLAATVTHASLGMHRGLLLEGYLRREASRRTSERVCAGAGALLFGLGAAAVIRVASGVLLH